MTTPKKTQPESAPETKRATPKSEEQVARAKRRGELPTANRMIERSRRRT